MHGVWDTLLDAEFLEAYEHGFKMECLDGVWRRFYPRAFTYSGDYPEKYVRRFMSRRSITNNYLQELSYQQYATWGVVLAHDAM